MRIEKYSRKKTIKNVLKELFPDYLMDEHFNFSKSEDEFEYRIGFSHREIAGQEVLYAHMNFQNQQLESIWKPYSKILELQPNVLYPTISVNTRNQGLANALEPSTVVLDNMSKEHLEDFIQDLFKNKFLPKLTELKSIENCDAFFNKEIQITSDFRSWTDTFTLPFRKVTVAKANNNQRLEEITSEMRKYCDKKYELGKQKNFEKLCALKTVFEKLFPE